MIKYILMILLFCGIAVAQTPIGYNNWDLGNGQKRAVIGKSIYNYPDSDSTFAEIDNTLLIEGDSILYCNTAALKTRINRTGQVAMTISHEGVTYGINVKPRKLIWLNTQTKDWIDVIPNLSWGTPAISISEVSWSFPGFDYAVIKSNGKVDYRITFREAFLDSAITLYNQRADSQYIALGNVHEFSFTNIDDSALIDVAEVDMKRLKEIGSNYIDISKQYLEWDGSDLSIPIRQRWVKLGGSIYLIEFVMMSDVKKIHEDYPLSNIWHSATTTITSATDVADTRMRSSVPTNNYGTTRTLYTTLTSGALMRVDNLATSLGAGQVITAVSCSLYQESGAGSWYTDFYTTWKPFGEGVGDGVTAQTGEASWSDWSSTDNEWGTAGCNSTNDAGSFNTGDGTGDDRTATPFGYVWLTASGWGFPEMDVDLANRWYAGGEEGIYARTHPDSSAFSIISSDGTTYYPRWVFTYEDAPSEGTSQVIIIQ